MNYLHFIGHANSKPLKTKDFIFPKRVEKYTANMLVVKLDARVA